MALSIKLLPSIDRPRERLIAAGAGALSDVELVAVVLGGDLDGAAALVGELGGARGIGRAGRGELQAVRGIGEARACQLIAALELGRRAALGPVDARPVLRTAAEVARYLADVANAEEEELHVVGLDTRQRPVARFLAARGGLNVVHVAPRDVFRRLVREGAVSTVVAHNHPSGDPSPSSEDLDLTRRLVAAGDLLGVPLVDHLVLARGGFHSFHDEIVRRARTRPPDG